MTTTIGGTTGVTFPDASTQNTAATGFGFKNRIINGAMMIDQRNAGASVTPIAGAYTLDRWQFGLTQANKLSTQQTTTAPTGFINSLLCTSLSTHSVVSGDVFVFIQKIEGLNVSDLGWGTSSAASVTLSFWVRSSLTGVFGGSLRNSAGNRSYPFTYTISSANTWEQKSITIAGDTSGTWLTTNGIGINISFSLGSGSTYSGTAGAWAGAEYTSATGATSVVGTSGATFYITGIQFEKGSTATSFDYRPYGTELALCQRYYTSAKPVGQTYTTSLVMRAGLAVLIGNVALPVTMRTTPTVGGITSWVTTTPASTGQVSGYISRTAAYATVAALTNSSTSTTQNMQLILQAGTTFGGAVAGDTVEFYAYELTASAEL